MGGMSVGILESDNDKCDLSLKLPSAGREQCTFGASGEDVVSQLSSAFDEALQVKEVEYNVDSPLDENDGSNIIARLTSEKSSVWEHGKTPRNVPPSTPVNCLCKSATFPGTDRNSATSVDSKDKAHASTSEDNFSCSRSMSLPMPRKIVPAMKGSREKAGLTLTKLNVTWAPDVYDPPPSSVSHLPKKKSNQQYRNNKKYTKGKHKGKNSRASSKKDKKHHREEPSSQGHKLTMDPFAVADTEKKLKFAMDPIAVADTEKKLKFAMDPIAVADTEKIRPISYNSTAELLDFDNDVDSPDSNCGSSFLRKSRGSLHFSYTETT